MHCCRQNPGRERLKRLIERADTQLEHTLDIRTLLRSQSILLSIVRVLFESEDNDPHSHLSLLALQRKGNLMDFDEGTDAVEHLLYGSHEND